MSNLPPFRVMWKAAKEQLRRQDELEQLERIRQAKCDAAAERADQFVDQLQLMADNYVPTTIQVDDIIRLPAGGTYRVNAMRYDGKLLISFEKAAMVVDQQGCKVVGRARDDEKHSLFPKIPPDEVDRCWQVGLALM